MSEEDLEIVENDGGSDNKLSEDCEERERGRKTKNGTEN